MVIGLTASAFRYSFKRTYPRSLSNLTASVLHARMSSSVKIGTHDGNFHCDEALACFLLKVLPRYKDAVIVRSRDNEILNKCDVVVDVGGVYDPSKHRYDHHMREFEESLSTVIKKPDYDCTIKLSSAGLVYCHFGHEIIRELLPKETSDEDVELIFKKVYNSLIKEIDAIDNGVCMYEGEPLYYIRTDLSSRVDRLNPAWNSQNKNFDEQFPKAVALTGEEFMYFVNQAANVWLPARSLVKDCLMKRFEVDPSGEIIELSGYVNYGDHIYDLENELNITTPIKIFLPEPWAGLRDELLSKVSGVEGSVFVHSARFIAGNKTRDGALAMARKSLEIGKSL